MAVKREARYAYNEEDESTESAWRVSGDRFFAHPIDRLAPPGREGERASFLIDCQVAGEDAGWRMCLDDGKKRCVLRLGRDPQSQREVLIAEGARPQLFAVPWRERRNVFQLVRGQRGDFRIFVNPGDPEAPVFDHTLEPELLPDSVEPCFEWGGSASVLLAHALVESLHEVPAPSGPRVKLQLGALTVCTDSESEKVRLLGTFSGDLPQLPQPLNLALFSAGAASPFWTLSARQLTETPHGWELPRAEARQTRIRRLTLRRDGVLECVGGELTEPQASLLSVDLAFSVGDQHGRMRGLGMRPCGRRTWVLV
jgi:hypothetical protein